MKKVLLLMVLTSTACSQIAKKTPAQDIPVKISETNLVECRNYQKNVLDKAYKEEKKGKKSELIFTKDLKEARTLISSFDVTKSLVEQKSLMIKNILNHCDQDRIKKFDQEYKNYSSCSLMFSELNYFQALAVALHKYKWPTILKLEGKKVGLDYVRFYSQGSFPLLNRLVALSVLDELSVNQVVNKDLHQEIKNLMQESRTYVEGLRVKLNKDPGLSCESMSIIQEELDYSNLVAKRMQEFLKKI
jgi:hypothetical protein